MDGFLSDMLEKVLPILGTVVLALVSWGLVELRKWVATKAKNERVNAALDHLSQAVYISVTELEQTTRKALKDGKLNDEEKADIKNRAICAVHRRISPHVFRAAQEAVEDLDSWLNGEVEASVFEMKGEIES